MEMMNRFFVVIFGIYILGCSSQTVIEKEQIPIYWSGKNEFARKVESSILSPKEAQNVVYEWKIKNESKVATFDTSELIVGDYYYFAPLSKIMGPLLGYYVHRNTGQLEFRTSDFYIKNTKSIPANIFDSIEILEPGKLENK